MIELVQPSHNYSRDSGLKCMQEFFSIYPPLQLQSGCSKTWFFISEGKFSHIVVGQWALAFFPLEQPKKREMKGSNETLIFYLSLSHITTCITGDATTAIFRRYYIRTCKVVKVCLIGNIDDPVKNNRLIINIHYICTC